MSFADNLRRVMAQRGIRPAQLGPLIGVTPTAVRMWLAGKTGPVEHRLAEVAAALGVPVAELFAAPSGLAENTPKFESVTPQPEFDRLPEIVEMLTRELKAHDIDLGPRRTARHAMTALEQASKMPRALDFAERARHAVEARTRDIRESVD